MSYNIFDSTAPAMPRHAKGTEIVKLLLSQASRDMSEPLVPMAIPALASHLTDVELSIRTTNIMNFVARWVIW